MSGSPSPSVRLARALATAGGAGYLPGAPGTAGTAVAVPLAALTASLSPAVYLVLCAAMTGIAIWAAGVADRSWGTHDDSRIVIDEVVGYFVTVAVIDRRSAIALLSGFVLFRFFDIVKPPPVRWIDRGLGGGAGVVLDDVAAGCYAAAVLIAAERLGLWAVP